jgi:N12 class adenine-specific DNA methylase
LSALATGRQHRGAGVETREQLNLAYDRFVARFGPINAASISGRFDGDPDLPLLLSLENYDEETKRAVKASIFRERTIHHGSRLNRSVRPRKRCSFP